VTDETIPTRPDALLTGGPEERMERLEAKAAWLCELAEKLVERVRNGETR